MKFPYTERLHALRREFAALPVFDELVESGAYSMYRAHTTFPTPTAAQIAAAEASLGRVLPPSYKEFIAAVTAVPPQFPVYWIGDIDSEFEITTRNTILHEPFARSLNSRGRDLPAELLAFGDDEALDVFAFDYSDCRTAGEPVIVLWHGLKEKQTIAASFREFIEQEIARLEHYALDLRRAMNDFQCSFKRFQDDVENLTVLLPRTRPPILRYSQATERIFDVYLAHGKIDQLIALGHRTADRQVRALSEQLVNERDLSRYHRLWRGVLTRRESAYRRAWSIQPYGAEDVRREAGEYETALSEALAGYRTLGDAANSAPLGDRLDCIRKRAQLPALPAPTDRRKIDETLFWSLIGDAGSDSSSPDETCAALDRLLRAFTTPGVKAFDKLFRKMMGLLNHWDIWALAYLREGGCSDDSFEYFRAGLVLRGKEVVTELCRDVVAGAALIPDGPIECEEAIYLGTAILEERGAEPSPRPAGKIKGTRWKESELQTRYPALAAWFER